MARIAIKVHPRAKRTAITGRLGEAYKLDLKAPPVDGKANEECVRFFAELMGVPRSAVRIVQGAAGRMKVVEIEDWRWRRWSGGLLVRYIGSETLRYRWMAQAHNAKRNYRF
jgi:uncharacterized protein (TIGR00251 family)